MWKRGGAILLALSILFGTGGCRQETETSVKPIALVVIQGNHNNSKLINGQIEEEIKRTYSSYGNMAVIINDGDPEPIYEGKVLLGYLQEKEIEQSKNKREKNPELWERDYLEKTTEKVVSSINGSGADDDEVDTLAAIQKAVDTMNYLENTLGEDIEKEIIICDTGLSTDGSFNFLDGESNALLNCEDKIDKNADCQLKLTGVIDGLKDSAELPDLEGISVTWYGLGEVDDPQPVLSSLQIYNLQYIWGTLLKEAGALESNISGIDDQFQYFAPVVTETMASYDCTVTPVIFWDEGEGIEIPAKKLGFLPDSAELKSKEDAVKVIEPYAANLNHYPDMEVLLVGTTADVNGGSVELSKMRAEKVKALLVELGISEEHILTVGLGADSPWHKDEWIDGIFHEEIAEENRSVYILSADSEEAESILSER